MKKILFLCFVLFAIGCKVSEYKSDSKPVNHAIFDSLLHKYVNAAGFVDYKGFRQDSVKLNEYLNLLSKNHPNTKNWTREEQLAYWINAYNAFTIKLVADAYPVKSIKDIKNGIPFVNTVWDIKFIKIEGRTYDLNNIEHGIIRPQFKDPRIHFAVNCASYSCPTLRAEAYTAEKLNAQLDEQATLFINDGIRNKISSDAKTADLSKIFSWFGGDFSGSKAGSTNAFINQYAKTKITDKTNVTHQEYNWELNEQK